MLRALLVLVVTAAGAAEAAAQSGAYLNRTGSGARAAGMANAFVAISDDGTAATWNPAGLARLRKPEMSLVASNLDLEVSQEGFRTLDGASTVTPRQAGTNSTFPEFASLAVPFSVAGHFVTVQAGWRRIYDLTNTFGGDVLVEPIRPDGPPARLVDNEAGTVGHLDLLSGAGAFSISSRLAVGVSVDFWRGNWTNTTVVADPPVPGGPADFLIDEDVIDLRGHNWTVGALVTWPKVNVGLVYRHPFDADMALDYSARTSLAPDVAGQADVDARLPGGYAVGVAWLPRPQWRVALDATRDEWKDFVIEGFPGTEGPVSFFDAQPPARTATRDTLSWALGAERIVERPQFVVPLRAGVAWEPQGGRDPVTRDPVDYVMVAAGAGLNTNALKLDAAVQYRWATFTQTQAIGLDAHLLGYPDTVGSTRAREWRVKVSAIYRLTDTSGLKGFFKKLFTDS